MCDFRPAPTGVVDRKTAQHFPASSHGFIWWSDKDKVTETGFYYIGQTGSYWAYFDKGNWYTDWYPDSKYDFLFPPHDHPHLFRYE